MVSQEHMNDTYGFPSHTWELAKTQARAVIRHRGARGHFITYQELTQEIRAIPFEPDSTVFHRMLGQISWEEDACGCGLLTALVIHKGSDGMPGPGFWELAKRLGRNTSDKVTCWTEEIKRVFADCKSKLEGQIQD